MAQHNDLGKKGEELAVDYLINHNYEVLERNYTYLKNEIDIIARINQMIVVVEVKTRSTADFGDPQDFLKKGQIERLVTAANHYLEHLEEDLEVRFDIIAVIENKKGTSIKHIEDAFYHF